MLMGFWDNLALQGAHVAYWKGAGVDDWLSEQLGEESPSDNRSECIYVG